MELAAYQRKDVANQWYNEWEDSKGSDAESSVWGDFVEAFLNQFFPQELRESKVEELMNLKQGKMSVKDYTLKFNQLSCYASKLVGNMRARMRKFASDLSDDLIKEQKKRVTEAWEKDRKAMRAKPVD
ncbi:uncharacterized protein LOC124896149 [Capsicum annuum]|uniref:uncharacterized protein LOC124896149 n=1 Tax=Capsicum annuum TaxID=4072 RepID=UPI001FB0A029|nr:uncharacterized protein LOC124896149 [Capsicum annuum]